ncbi:MAG: AI-2E family transporter [Cellulosilyticaceae bacterium]|uniref:AI-2E family transporter n=1 Tax=Niameybacter sp. TaxID=2033640 RepID=UPI002FC902A7
MDKGKLKSNLLLITYAILLFLTLQNWPLVMNVLKEGIHLIIPFIYGFVIAYLLNKPFNFFYNKVFKFDIKTKYTLLKHIRKPIALAVTYLSIFTIFIVIISLLVPQLATSIETLTRDLPEHYKAAQQFALTTFEDLKLPNEFILDIQQYASQIVQQVLNFLYTALPNVLDSIFSITSSITNIIFGFIISVYLLSSKEKLVLQGQKLLLAFTPTSFANQVIRVSQLTHKTFGNFISGQILDAFILGLMCFISMSILRMPYALLVSVIIGLSNMIPILGPILGAIPTTFIILMANPTHPIQALWFIILIIILQQIDGDIIYPRVVGNSIGLSGLWVMFAILVAGGKFGIVGMIIGVPTFAIIYTLLREATYTKLKTKKIKITEKDIEE